MELLKENESMHVVQNVVHVLKLEVRQKWVIQIHVYFEIQFYFMLQFPFKFNWFVQISQQISCLKGALSDLDLMCLLFRNRPQQVVRAIGGRDVKSKSYLLGW